MDWKRFFVMMSIMVYCSLFWIGCGVLFDTLSEVSSDVPGYIQESSGINIAFGDIMPDGSKFPVGVGIGYIIGFLRRMYVNYMKAKSKKGV